MGTVSAKKLEESLAKAKGVGLVEEPFTIGDVEVVLRNLRPDEYQVALEECAELEELAYLNKFQESHICRAIQELNGVSLRDIDFVECEETDANKKTRTVKRERHEWLRRHILSTWSREAMYTAYRKFTDVTTLAEKKAKENVTFLTPDESEEEQFRRLVGELKELEGNVPPALVTAILQESGYTHFTHVEDREALESLDKLASEPEGETPQESEPSSPVESPRASPSVPATPLAKQAQATELLRRRVPLNQQVEDAPEPPPPPVAPVQPPPQPQVAPQAVPVHPVVSKRSAEFLADEALFEQEMRAVAPVGVVPPGAETGIAPELLPRMPSAVPTRDVAEIRPQDRIDPNALAGIVEQPPAVGLNPKFRRPV